MAGESAQESARRHHEKAQRLLHAAALYEKGAEGERVTAEVLDALPDEHWIVMHDLRWPGRRYANVDHIVVGPPGIFVVDSKNWSGRIEVRHQVLQQNGYKREQSVAGAAEAALAVAGLVPSLRVDLVAPVLCFVRDEPLLKWARDVMVCSTANLLTLLQSRTPVLEPWQVRVAALHLEGQLSAAIRQGAPARPAVVTARRGRATRAGQLGRLLAVLTVLYLAYAVVLSSMAIR